MKKLFIYITVLCMTISVFPGIMHAEAVSGSSIYVPQGTVLSCYTDDDIKQAADKLFAYLDPKSDTAADVLTLYQDGRYKDALIVFRNYMIDRIRSTPITNLISNTGAYYQATWYNTIEVICGNMTVDEYNQKHNSNLSDPFGYTDYTNTSTDSALCWTATAADGASSLPMPGLGGFGGRCAQRYAVTKNEQYLKKYFQIMYDYSQNYRQQIEAPMEGMTDEEKLQYAQETDGRVYIRLGGRYAASNLAFVHKALDMVGSLAVICKALPSEYSKSTNFAYYASEGAVFTDKLDESVYDLIDPVRFAGYCYHLMYNEMVRVGGYTTVGAISNQRMEGLAAYFRYTCMFRDFTLAWDETELMYNAINTLVNDTFHPDGGILEKSFNYNIGDAKTREYLYAYGAVMCPEMAEGIKNISKYCGYWNKIMEGYKSNLGLLPSVGNVSNRGTPNIWNNESARSSMEEATAANRELPYTSVYYPYSGYAAMRNNWNTDGLYMAMYNNPNSYSGHRSAAANAILNLSAYGRTMLLSGGAPWYGRSYCPQYTDFLESGYDEINGYFSEASGRKNSTVMVNNKSQAYENSVFATTDDILPNRWLSDNSFDFSEGTWTGRYTPFDTESALTSEYTSDDIEASANHMRQIIFLKDVGLWVVLDKAENKNSKVNTYTQVWNFSQYQELSNYSDGKGGYKNEQVECVPGENLIKTTDASGPNLFIMNFSGTELSYEKKYGEFIPGQTGWGWSTGGGSAYASTGAYAPSVDALVSWEDKGSGSTSVATVLAPSENTENIVLSSSDLSTADTTAFELVTKDFTITYHTSDSEASYQIGDINVNAKTVLVQSGNGICKSIVLGCSKINGNTPQYEDFEITVGDSVQLTPINVPERFDWVENSDNKEIPVYSDDEYYGILKSEIDVERLQEDFLNINENNFDVFIEKYWAYFEIDYDEYKTIDYPEYVYRELPDDISVDTFGDIVNNVIKQMKFEITYNQDYALAVYPGYISWDYDTVARLYPLYSGFDIPLGSAVESASVTITKKGSNTNVRSIYANGYIEGEHPGTLAYKEKNTDTLYSEWTDFISKNEKQMPNNLSFSFAEQTNNAKAECQLPDYMINSINRSSKLILKIYSGDNLSIIAAPEEGLSPYLKMTYDKSAVLKALESDDTYLEAKYLYNIINNIHTMSITENYNHYTDGNGSSRAVKTNYSYVSCRALNKRVTFVNFKLPQIDTSKIKSVKYVLTTKQIGVEQAQLGVFGVHIPYTEWLTSAETTTGGSGIAMNNEIAYNKAMKYYSAAKAAGPAITVADLVVDQETAVDVTDFIKNKISIGNDSIDMFVSAYSQTTQFYSKVGSANKAPRMEFEIDCSNADSELSVLSASGLKSFVNTYSAYYGVDYSEINKYSDVSDIYERLSAIEGWNTRDGFKPAFESAVNAVSVKSYETKETDNMYFSANGSERTIKLNENVIYNVGNNRRKGLVGFAVPDIDAELIKSVKMVATPKETPTVDTFITVRAHGALDSSLFTAGTTEENFLAMEKILEESISVLASPATFNVTANSPEVAVTGDITDYMKEYMKSGKDKIYFSFGQPWNIGSFSIYTGQSENAIKLVYEVRDDLIESELLAINDASELNAFLQTDKPDVLGISTAEYKGFTYPEYVANRIIEIGYTDTDSFKEAFDKAVSEFKVSVEIECIAPVHYRTPDYWNDYWTDSNGNQVDNGVKKGLVVHNVGGGGTSPAYAAVFFTFELPETFKAMSGTAKMNIATANTTARSVSSKGYSNQRTTVPAPGLYEIGSDEANAWFAYADILTDSPSIFTADGSMKFTFAANSKTASVNMSDGMISALNAAAGEDGSKFFTFSLAQGENLYVNNLTLELTADGTLIKKAAEEREEALLSAVNNQTEADIVLTIFKDFDDILKLSSNTDYQKVNKTDVAQAVIDGIGDGYVSVDALLAVINTAVASWLNTPFVITAATNENNTISVSVKKNTEAANAVVIAAAYKNGSFSGAKTAVSEALNNAQPGADIITVNIENVNFDADTSVKVFVWENTSSLKALSKGFDVK